MGLLKKSVGSVPVPGEATVTLTAGRLTINYDEARHGRSTGVDVSEKKRWPGLPGDMVVSVRPAAGGAELAIVPRADTSEYATLKRIGSKIGTVQIPADGDYVVTIAPFTTKRELFDPRVDLKA